MQTWKGFRRNKLSWHAWGEAAERQGEADRKRQEELEEEHAVLFLAVAVRDCIPSPYDTEALAFR